MEFECNVEGCHFKATAKPKILEHIQTHSFFAVFDLYEKYKKLDVDKTGGK